MILLSPETDEHIQKFVSRERPLREYVKEIEKMKNMASEIASLPVYVPMHFFLLDCTGINLVRTFEKNRLFSLVDYTIASLAK